MPTAYLGFRSKNPANFIFTASIFILIKCIIFQSCIPVYLIYFCSLKYKKQDGITQYIQETAF